MPYQQRSGALRALIDSLNGQYKYREALACCLKLIDVANEHGDNEDRLEAAIQGGRCAVCVKEYETAIGLLNGAAATLSTIRAEENDSEHQNAEGELYLVLGQAYRHTERASEAKECYIKAMQIADAIRDDEMKLRPAGNIDLMEVDAGAFEDAIKHLEETRKAYFKLSDHRLASHARFNLA